MPAGQPCIQIWRENTDAAVHALSRIAASSVCSSTPFVPVLWCNVELAWLPKPGKPPVTPKSLRSVGSTAADTKACLILLKKRATETILASLWHTPQFAYRPGVDTNNAILHAVRHCRSVRDMQRRRRGDHTSKLLDNQSGTFTGGMMISLDLAKAFDSVPHSELSAALSESGVELSLIECLLAVHQQTRCEIRHSGQVRAVNMGRGLQQGCPIAPILFSAWTARLCRVIDAELGEGWIQTHLRIFADDTWGSWKVHGASQMRAAFRDTEKLFEIFQRLGVSINFEKSSLVISMHGSGKHGLSYGSFEAETVRLRVEKATSNFNQLRRVLRTNGALSKEHRLRIYVACVWSSLRYGVCAMGITQHTCGTIVSTLCMQLRKVPAWGHQSDSAGDGFHQPASGIPRTTALHTDQAHCGRRPQSRVHLH